MQTNGIKIANLREINRVLNAVGVPKKEVSAAAKRSAQVLVDEARSLVPVRSGRLRDSIRIGATGTGKTTIRAGNNTTIQYANPIHWGWFKRKIRPQPFFSKALGYKREEIYQKWFEEFERLITEQAFKNR